MKKLLRTIRFDETDARVFAIAAVAGEWAVSGAFTFAGGDPAAITGKAKQAFANGFLGVGSFGRSTFATVGEASDSDIAEMTNRLAAHFTDVYGAPDLAAASSAADDEIAFAADLCKDLGINTVLTVRRVFDASGAIREEFRTISPPAGEPMHAKVWTIESDDA